MARLYVRNETANLSGTRTEVALTWKRVNRWLGVLWDHDGPLTVSGVIDIGDPYDSVWMATPLPQAQTRAVEQYLGLPNNSLRGSHPLAVLFTIRQVGHPLQFDHPDGIHNVWLANADVMGTPLAVARGAVG